MPPELILIKTTSAEKDTVPSNSIFDKNHTIGKQAKTFHRLLDFLAYMFFAGSVFALFSTPGILQRLYIIAGVLEFAGTWQLVQIIPGHLINAQNQGIKTEIELSKFEARTVKTHHFALFILTIGFSIQMFARFFFQ